MAKKTYHDGHKALWNWLAETGDRSKINAPVWQDPKYAHLLTEKVMCNHCFACHGRNYNHETNSCLKCPVEWGTESLKPIHAHGIYCMFAKGSPYANWIRTGRRQLRKAYAQQIANLHWKRK